MGRRKKKKEPERVKTKFIFISDIHSEIDTLRQLPDRVPEWHDENTKIVFLGDYIDGYNQSGTEGLEVLRFISKLHKSGKAIVLIGNHDYPLLNLIQYSDIDSKCFEAIEQWSSHGGIQTMSSWGFNPNDMRHIGELLKHSEYEDVYEWLLELKPEYYADLGYRMCSVYGVHAGFDLSKCLRDQDNHKMMWIRDDYFDYPQYLQNEISADFIDSVIVSGHTPNRAMSELITDREPDDSVISKYENWHNINRYFIDAGANSRRDRYVKQLNILIIDDVGQYIRDELIEYKQK